MIARFAVVLFLVATLTLAGCGSARTHVTGKVTYKGSPVAYGQITFVPQRGAAGTARIRDGAYDTRKGGDGPSPGAGVVRIQGFDGQPNPDQPLGNLVFYYEEKIDLPTKNSTKDFIVPDDAPNAPPERDDVVP